MNRDHAAAISALAMIASGIILVFCAFFRSPDGTLSDSVLWYMGEALMYAGSVFGLKSYIDSKMKPK